MLKHNAHRTLTVALVLALACIPAVAQALSPACYKNCSSIFESCGKFDVACAARNAARLPAFNDCRLEETTCQTKLELYNAYMTNLGQGVVLHSLPAVYRQVLAQHYPGVNLANVRFGRGTRQPSNNATTDCMTIYFNDAVQVDKMRNGTLNSDQEIYWMLHELQHTVQCQQAGGRDFYAKMWFEHLSLAFLNSSDLAQIHDNMPMEGNATSVGSLVLTKLQNCCIDGSYYIVPPLVITGVARSGGALRVGASTPVVLTVSTSGGSSPISYTWRMKRPGQSGYYSIPSSEGTVNGNVLTWTPQSPGTYSIRVRAHQAGTSVGSEHTYLTYTVQQQLALPAYKDNMYQLP